MAPAPPEGFRYFFAGFLSSSILTALGVSTTGFSTAEGAMGRGTGAGRAAFHARGWVDGAAPALATARAGNLPAVVLVLPAAVGDDEAYLAQHPDKVFIYDGVERGILRNTDYEGQAEEYSA